LHRVDHLDGVRARLADRPRARPSASRRARAERSLGFAVFARPTSRHADRHAVDLRDDELLERRGVAQPAQRAQRRSLSRGHVAAGDARVLRANASRTAVTGNP
jgi:hypothetical protein